jgi:hypothetical protein
MNGRDAFSPGERNFADGRLGVAVNWDVLFKTLSTIAAFYQLTSITPGSRATLKTDLEILKLLRASTPDYKSDADYLAVRTHVDETIRKTYRGGGRRKLYRDPDFLKGIFTFLLFFGITVYMLKDGFTFWSLVPGFVALTGLGGVSIALKRKGGARAALPPGKHPTLPDRECKGAGDARQ